MDDNADEWLSRAQKDLEFADVGMRERFFSHVCFLSQQASEKALKAILIRKAQKYPRIHSIAELMGEVAKCVDDLNLDEQMGRVLDQYYIPTRYPDGVPGSLPEGQPSEKHASEGLEIAKRIVQEVEKRFGI